MSRLIIGTVLVLSSAVTTITCKETCNSSGCGEATEYAVTYGGSANGEGYVKLAPLAGGDLYDVVLSLIGPPLGDTGSEVIMQLAGQGRCIDGRLDATFGAASAENGRFKILGGTFSAILRGAGPDGPMGRWSAEAHDTETDRNLTLGGFWGVKTASDGADAP